MAVAGLVLSLVAGYLSMSAVTSQRADAVLCFSGNNCITVGGNNITQVITQSFMQVNVMAAAQVGGELVAYLELANLQYMEFMKQSVKAAKNKIKQATETFWFYNLHPSLQMITEQLAVANAEQTQALIKFQDAAAINRTKLDLELAEAEAIAQTKPAENACVAATVSQGMVRASTMQQSYNAQAPVTALAGASSLNPQGTPVFSRSTNTAGTPAAKGTATDIAARAKNVQERYYNPAANNGHAGCDNCTAGPDMDRDMDVTGEIFAKQTIGKNDLKTVVNDLLTNLAEPFVLNDIPEEILKTKRGQDIMLARQSYRAKRQVVFDALYHSVARRVPGSKMGAFLNEIKSAAGFQMPANSNPSRHEVMETMMNDRFRSGAYSISQVDWPETNSKEMVIQQAFQAMQLSDHLDLLDRYALVLAARGGDSANQSKDLDNKANLINVRKQ